MSELIQLIRGRETEADLDTELRAMVADSVDVFSAISERGGGEDWDAPLDLRVARPRTIDLRTVWKSTDTPVPPQLAGALGATRPILIVHTITPFPVDGRSPIKVWGLGYELVAHDVDADTVAFAIGGSPIRRDRQPSVQVEAVGPRARCTDRLLGSAPTRATGAPGRGPNVCTRARDPA